LRKKSTVIRASLKAGKRIHVIEDSAVSPQERLRLIKIDNREFVMVSAKGTAPYLMPLVPRPTQSSAASPSETAAAPTPKTTNTATNTATNMATNMATNIGSDLGAMPADAPQFPSDTERQALAAKFENWRQQNAGR
jgi:flagellar biogenesis protein FliO